MTLLRSGIFIVCLSGLLTISLMVSPAHAIILQNSNQPTAIPGSGAIGSFGNNASCVVIAPNFIVTTRHQGYSTAIEIDGVSYTAVQQWTHSTADIRVVRIEDSNSDPANLAPGTWAELWTAAQGSEVGQEIVIGGYGVAGTRFGSGYQWAPGTTVDQLRWGTNEIDSALTKSSYGGGTSDVLEYDFTRIASGTDYEAAVGYADSGGGLYIEDTGTWYVAGLTRSVQRADYTGFGDWADGVRISSYADWVYDITRVDGDANGDLKVSLSDLTILATNYDSGPGRTWYQGDFSGDGEVTLADLTMLATTYGFDGTGGMPTPLTSDFAEGVPEPSTMLLLAAAGPALLARRRRKSH